jgi:beta-lactamase class A
MPAAADVLLAIYLLGVVAGLIFTDARWLPRVSLALLWPLGPLAFVVTISILVLSLPIAFPIVGTIVLGLIAAAITAAITFAAPAVVQEVTPRVDARLVGNETTTPIADFPHAATAARASASLQVDRSSGLQRLLEAELARFPAQASIYVKHLTSGAEAAVRADAPFNSASVIKIPIMVLAYKRAEAGTLALDGRVEIRKSDFRAGSGVLRYHDSGLRPTVRDLITQMIITSDNTATDLMIAQVGGVPEVNAWLKANDYGDQRLNTTIYEVFKRRYAFADPSLASLTPEELYALQSGDPAFAGMPRDRFDAIQKTMTRPGLADELNRQVSEEPSTWFGQVTARSVGRMLEAIERCTIAAKSSCVEMTRAFRRQQSGARRLPHFLSVPVGHKTGDFPPMLANDVGVIYARSGPIVVAFLTNGIREPYAETEDRIGRAARSIVDYFDGASGR